MPRTPQFHRETALNNALYLFWRQGYHATSMKDIEEAMEACSRATQKALLKQCSKWGLPQMVNRKQLTPQAMLKQVQEAVVQRVNDLLQRSAVGHAVQQCCTACGTPATAKPHTRRPCETARSHRMG